MRVRVLVGRLGCHLWGHRWIAPAVAEPALSYCVCLRCGAEATMLEFYARW